jgi:hypothetical protein
MSLYNEEIKQIISQASPPASGFILDVVEYEDFPGIILRCYSSNYYSFNHNQRAALSRYVHNIMVNIRLTGVLCEVERL